MLILRFLEDPPREPGPPMLRIASTSFQTDPLCLNRSRRWVCARLISTPHSANLGEVLVCVNELATNALRHSASGHEGGSFLLSLAWDQTSLRISITDQGGSGQPELTIAGDDHESGRGLHVVAGLADRWGFEVTRLGCQVWVEFTVADKNTSDSPAAVANGGPGDGTDQDGTDQAGAGCADADGHVAAAADQVWEAVS